MKKLSLTTGIIALLLICIIPSAFAVETIVINGNSNVWTVNEVPYAKQIETLTVEIDTVINSVIVTTTPTPLHVTYKANQLILVFKPSDLPETADSIRIFGDLVEGTYSITLAGFAWGRR